MATSPLLPQRGTKSAQTRPVKRSQGLSQTDYQKLQQYPQVAQLLQSPNTTAKIKYKSQEEYFDEVNELKQANRKLKEENAFLLGRTRSLEKQLNSEDRLLNLNLNATSKAGNVDGASNQVTTGGSPRLRAPSPKAAAGAGVGGAGEGGMGGAGTVHLIAYKKQLVALKAQLAAAQARCTALENDVRRSNLDQWRSEKETYYQEVQRLQAVMRLKEDAERQREQSRPSCKPMAVQTDELTVHAYTDLALRQMLSQREGPQSVVEVVPKPPKSPATPQSGDYQTQHRQVSRLKALLCTIMTQAQKIRGLAHENRMLRVRIEAEENEARRSIQQFVSNRLESIKAEMDGHSTDIDFVSLSKQPSAELDTDATFEADRQKGKRLGQDWILTELLARGDRIMELEEQVRQLRMQLSMRSNLRTVEALSLDDYQSEVVTADAEAARAGFKDEPEKPFEDTSSSALIASRAATEPPTEVLILPDSAMMRFEAELQSARSLGNDSVNELADLLRGYVHCKNVRPAAVSRTAPEPEPEAEADPTPALAGGPRSSLDSDEVDMLVSHFLAHQSNKQRRDELRGLTDTNGEGDEDDFDQLRAALLAHSVRRQKLHDVTNASASSGPSAQQSALTDDELQTLMSSLAAHQARQRQMQQLEFLSGARTKQYSKV